MSGSKTSSVGKFGLLALAVGAVGVVFGDIGTSPLYAVNEIFAQASHFAMSPTHALEAISLIFWALTLLVGVEYIGFVLSTDYDGEGGVFALLGILGGRKSRNYRLLIAVLMLSAGFLYGDGVITPAISVLSAVEGLKVATNAFTPFIEPLTIIILTLLFAFQYKGTGKMGAVFGPIMVVWFLTIGALGLIQIVAHPQILGALNPLYAVAFLHESEWHVIFAVLGAVMLAVTGGEALYADMGHFGRYPIRLGWIFLVFPCLLLNYFGQGAYVFSGKPVAEGDIFYSLVPHALLYPMVILATLAAIIASQALITGVFSLTSQATRLGLLPQFTTVHTNSEHVGQIYLPALNWFLYTGCILLVLIFKSSTNLAAAYGLAVSALMCVTAIAMGTVAKDLWKWNSVVSTIIFGLFTLLCGAFLVANSIKFFNGGYLPIAIGIGFFFAMSTWAWGRDHIRKAADTYVQKDLHWVKALRDDPLVPDLPRAIVFLTSRRICSMEDRVPSTFFFFFHKYGAVPAHLLFFHMEKCDKPYISLDERYERFDIADRVSALTVRYGFMEQINVRKILEERERQDINYLDVPAQSWIIEVRENETIISAKTPRLVRARLGLYGLLNSFSRSEHSFFELGHDAGISTQKLPIEFTSGEARFHFPEWKLPGKK